MVKRVCRSSTAVMLMVALLFTTFASLFIFTNEDAQGAATAKSSGLTYLVEQDKASGGLAYGLGNVWGFKYKATPVKSSSAEGYYASNWMFCVQPSKNGWSSNSKLYDNSSFKLYEDISRTTDVETMYKAIYYSIAGPGWDVKDSKGNYTWRKKIDDAISNRKASLSTACRYDNKNDIYYTVTHLVVSYIYANKKFSNDDMLNQMTQAWKNVISDLTKEYAKQPSVKDKMSLYIANYNNGQSSKQQSMVIATFSRRLRVVKTSSDERFTKGQGVDSNNTGAIKSKSSSEWNTQLPAYTYAGAKFAIFNDEAKAKKAAAGTTEGERESGSTKTLTVKSNGKTDEYLIGISDTSKNYYAVEVKAPTANYASPANKYYKFEKTKEYSSIDGLPIWSITVKNVPRTANLKIIKASANTNITKNNSNYSLAGAKFAIFVNKADADNAVKGKTVAERTKNSLALKITTDANGVGIFQDSKGKTVNLPILASSQPYYAVEYVAPKGYTLYNSVITLPKGSRSGDVYQYSATVKENPKSDPIGVIAQKKDAVQGTYDTKDLEGAVFEVKYYDVDPTQVKTLTNLQSSGKSAVRTWYFKTDEDGQIYYADKYLVNSSEYKSSSLYIDTVVNASHLPIGAITVKEVKGPTSGLYEMNPTTFFSTVTGTEADVKVDLNITIPENPSTTMISVLKESDDGLVSNIYFRITSSDGKVNEIIKTDESGSAYLDGLDVYTSDGKTKIKYTVSELGLMTSGSDADRQKAKYKIPGRYKKPADQTTELVPNKPSQIVFVNEIETGTLNIIKKADDNSDSHNTVENVAFKITNGSDATKVYTVLTDSNGNASLDNLPIYDDNGSVVKYKVTELGVASTVQRNYIYGDVDFDGIISANDALYVSKYAAGLINLDATQLKVADVNGDGKVTEADNICIRSYNIGITDTDEIGKTGTVCSELGEGQFTEYTIPKRYEKQADQTITLTANKTLTVTFNNKTLKGRIVVTKDSYDNVVSNLWFNVTASNGTDVYCSTDSKGYATIENLPVYDDNDEQIAYTVTELGFKQDDGTYLFPAYYVEQEPQVLTLDEAVDSNNDVTYRGSSYFYNRMYLADLFILKNFSPITETGVYAKFRIKSVTDGYSFDNTYTTQLVQYVGDSLRNGYRIHDLQPFLADGTSIVYEISEIELVDGSGNRLSEDYMTLLDEAQVSWTRESFEDATADVDEDEESIVLTDTYVVDNYYSMGHLVIYKTADDGDIGDVWFKIECSDSIVDTQYVKTDKTGRAELDKIVSGTVKGGQLTYTVTELGKMTSGSEDAPDKATFEIPSKYEKPEPKTFSFDAGEIEPERVLAFSNKLYGSFRIHKVDENGKGIAGAVFQLLDLKGNVVGTCTTDSTGYSNTLTQLEQGIYTVKEISTPKGFYLLRSESTVYIGNATVNEFYPWIGNDFVEGTQYFYGDVNMDGTVDAEDSTLVQRYINNLTTLTDMQKLIADVTKDGEININDAGEINRYVARLKVTDLNYVYDVVETEQPPFPPAGGMNLLGVIIASSLFLVSLGSLMIVRRKAGK